MGGRSMPSLARLIVVGTALVIAAAAAPVAQADPLPLSHQGTAVADTPNDGVIAPGDDLAIIETVHNGGVAPLTGLQATLSSSTPGVVVTDDTKGYPNIDPGLNGANASAFHVHFPNSLLCGTTLNFTLSFTSAAGNATVPFTLTTGAKGPFVDYVGNPTVIGDATPTLRPHLASLSYSGTATVGSPGIVKGVEAVVGDLAHPNIGHLVLELVAPDGTTRTTLVDHRGTVGDTFTGTVFASDALDPISGGSSPFNGPFRPDGDLGTFGGLSQQGPWKLAVSEADPTEIGRLNSWTLRIAPADCKPRSVAQLSLSAARIDPGGSVTLSASQSVSVAPGGITGYEWDLGTGSFAAGPMTRPPDTFPTRGRYTIKVRVSDGGGVIGIASKDLIVSYVPTASITLPATNPKEGTSVVLTGSGSDPDGTAITYAWDVDGDGEYDDASGATPTVSFPVGSSGAHTIKLRVTDVDGATGDAQAVLNVLPTQPPSPSIVATPNPVLVGNPVVFDASASSDPDGSVVGYEWDLDGNGSFETPGGSSPLAGRAYPNPTVLGVGVRVTDNDGRTAVARVPLTIQTPAGGGGGGASGQDPSGAAQGAGGSGGSTPGGSSGGGDGGGDDGSGGSGSGSGGGRQTLAASLQGAPIQGLKLVTKKGLGLLCSADRAATCSVTASLQPADARKLGLSRSKKKAYVLGRTTVRLKKAGKATITVRLSRKVLGKLKRTRRVTVLVTGTAVDSAGAKIALRRAVLLRR
jgi:subtilisin-like proprotein convertase family protein